MADELGSSVSKGQPSVLEISHRSKTCQKIFADTELLLRRLLAIDDEFEVLFLPGGASQQFIMLPMNFLNSKAAYANTGYWSDKAIDAAKGFGEVVEAYSSKADGYHSSPTASEVIVPDGCDYLHITSNNTIFGSRYIEFPTNTNAPLIADMSSELLARPIDVNKFAAIYASAQKNLGPAGVTIMIIRRQLASQTMPNIPTFLQYASHVEKKSMYNTPPVFAVYGVKLVLEWLENEGGLAVIEKRNEKKAALIYEQIDGSEFYKGHAKQECRSMMNIPFTLADQSQTERFLSEATAAGMHSLKGHRSVGGVRASMYNAMPVEGAEKLAEFMHNFVKGT
jgi:phosphoserine aminotransferase